MSYEAFKTCLTDPKDGRYMDMERLMNTVYPVEKSKRDMGLGLPMRLRNAT